jgi:CO/xanthine dehydrogenase Mo-binding subunit
VEYRPWTRIVPEHSEDVRRTSTRRDTFERVSGQAVYTRDVYLQGMLYAKILLSPYASARIVRIDTSKASGIIGTKSIFSCRGRLLITG